MSILNKKTIYFMQVVLLGCFLSIGSFSMAASETKDDDEAKVIAGFLQPASGTKFIRLDDNINTHAHGTKTTSLKVYAQYGRAIQDRLADLAPGTILVLTAVSLLLDNASPHPVVAHAGAGAGGASASRGGSAGARDAATPNILDTYGFREYTASDLFGSGFLAKVAADGYRFFVKGIIAAEGETGTHEEQTPSQSTRFENFQKAMGDYYISIYNIVGTGLPPIPAWAASLKTYVVIKDSELETEKTKIERLFAANPEFVAVFDMGTEPYVKEGVLTLQKEQLSENIHNLRITNTNNNFTQVGEGFLYHFTSLSSIDLSGLKNVTQIGDYFLTACKTLKFINLSPLRGVRHIGVSLP